MVASQQPLIAKQLFNLTREKIRVAARTEDGRKQIMVTLEPVGEAKRREILERDRFDELFTMLVVDQDAMDIAKELERQTGDLVIASAPDMRATCEVETEEGGYAIETVTVSRLATIKYGHDVVLEIKAA